MSEVIPIMEFVEMQALMMEPNWADVSPSTNIVLPFYLPEEILQKKTVAEIERWIFHKPIPVVGVARQGVESSLDSIVDIVATDDADVDALLKKIIRNPHASAVLVQIIRSTLTLSISQALNLESLAYSTLQGGEEFSRWLKGYVSNHGGKPPVTQPEPVVQTIRQGNQLEINLNTPGNRNALSVQMRDTLTEVFKLVLMDPTIKYVHVSGNGPCFSAGGDLSEFGVSDDQALAHQIRLMRMPAQYLSQASERYTFHLHGACIGAGLEMPAFAKHLVATPDTFFHLPEISMGLIPGAGGCVSIPRRIGRQRMNYLAITGTKLSVETAINWGLIDEIAG
jgi:enoyl-CoA hydratase/carnithine racemase